MAAAVALNIAGVDVETAEAAMVKGAEVAALEAAPKAEGVATAATLKGRGVLTAKANGAEAAGEAVLTGVLAGMPGNWKPPDAADAAVDEEGFSAKDSPVLGKLVAALEVAAAEDAPKPPKDANAGVDCADAVAVDCPKGIAG